MTDAHPATEKRLAFSELRQLAQRYGAYTRDQSGLDLAQGWYIPHEKFRSFAEDFLRMHLLLDEPRRTASKADTMRLLLIDVRAYLTHRSMDGVYEKGRREGLLDAINEVLA